MAYGKMAVYKVKPCIRIIWFVLIGNIREKTSIDY